MWGLKHALHYSPHPTHPWRYREALKFTDGKTPVKVDGKPKESVILSPASNHEHTSYTSSWVSAEIAQSCGADMQ